MRMILDSVLKMGRNRLNTATFRLTLLCALSMTACADDNTGGGPQVPLLTGSGGSTQGAFKMETHTVAGQKFDIYIPPEYSPSTSLPILYFNDGDLFSDVFEILMVEYPEPFIMVGIHAGRDRTSKYVPYEDEWITNNWGDYTPNAANYSKTLVEKVIPFVETRYAVDVSRRAIFGMSLGGLHATWIGINYPDFFSFVGALSPSFWVADYAIIRNPISGLSADNRFYFDMGTYEWNYYVPFIESLENANLVYGKSIFYYEVFKGLHNRGSWGKRIHIPFLLFLSQGSPTGEVSFELIPECIESVSTPGRFFQRLNPLIKYGDGVIYSLTTEATYSIIEGKGEVTSDGRYEVDGNSMMVKVSFGSWNETVEVSNCN